MSAMVEGYTDMKPSHLAEEQENTRHVLSAMGNRTENDAQTSLDSKRQNALSRPDPGLWGGAHSFIGLTGWSQNMPRLNGEKAHTS